VKQLGYLINGIEFIPQHIAEHHLPFGCPPGQTIEVVWSLDDDRDAELQRLRAELDNLYAVVDAERENIRYSIVRRLNAESERDALKREINVLRATWTPPEDDSAGMF
jgi:hypothetical protein